MSKKKACDSREFCLSCYKDKKKIHTSRSDRGTGERQRETKTQINRETETGRNGHIYSERQRARNTDRRTDRETERQSVRVTDRETERQIESETAKLRNRETKTQKTETEKERLIHRQSERD